MAEAWRVTNALLAKLQGDATLAALMPDGAWLDEAPPGAKRFVIVSLIDSTNVRAFGGLAWIDSLYWVEARALSTTGGNVHLAASRVAVLLDPLAPLAPATLAFPAGSGYAFLPQRGCGEQDTERIEVDEIDPSIRWKRCGGHYRIQVAPIAA